MQKFSIKSFSGDKDHVVIWHDNGDWECDCMGFMMKPYKACNHILKAQGLDTSYDKQLKLKHNKLLARYRLLQDKLEHTSIEAIKTREKIQARMDKLKDIILKIREELGVKQ